MTMKTTTTTAMTMTTTMMTMTSRETKKTMLKGKAKLTMIHRVELARTVRSNALLVLNLVPLVTAKRRALRACRANKSRTSTRRWLESGLRRAPVLKIQSCGVDILVSRTGLSWIAVSVTSTSRKA